MLTRRRAATADAWDVGDAVVLVSAGEEIPVPGRGDRTYPFRAHSEYLYLTDRERPGGVLAYDPGEGWVEFVRPVTAEELLWTGLEGDREGVPEGTRAGGRAGGMAARTRPFGASAPRPTRTSSCATSSSACGGRRTTWSWSGCASRRSATRAGFAELVRLIEPGVTERDLEIAIGATFLRVGRGFPGVRADRGRRGPQRGAPLLPHLPRAEGGELLLVDAGAEYRGYASDVTRTYPIGGELEGEQRVVWETVVPRVRGGDRGLHGPDASGATSTGPPRWSSPRGWSSSACCAASPRPCSRAERCTLFFPHGVGHMVGLGIRDAGAGDRRAREPAPGLPGMRLDIPLEPRHVWTVEPGIYFVAPLLRPRPRPHATSTGTRSTHCWAWAASASSRTC